MIMFEEIWLQAYQYNSNTGRRTGTVPLYSCKGGGDRTGSAPYMKHRPHNFYHRKYQMFW